MTQPDNRDGPPVFLPEPALPPNRQPANEAAAPEPAERDSAPQPGRGTRLEPEPAKRSKRRIPLLLLFIMLAASLYVSAAERSPIPFLIGAAFFVFYFRNRRG